MDTTRKIASYVLTAAIAIGVACTTVPETGRSQLSLVNSDEVLQMSLTEFDKIKGSTPISKDAQQNALVKRVGERIAKVVQLPNAKWEFVVFNKPDVLNAFALPGGKVGVYSGLFQVTKNEAGLATVLGHEVAHAVARHGQERVSQGLLLQLGGAALSQAVQARPETVQQIVQTAYGVGANVGFMLPHSRQQELEADHLGLLFMARAGYDPHEAAQFWKRFRDYNQQHGGGKGIEFLQTHPLDGKRIQQIEELMPKAEAEYQKAH
ncbi:MAG: M48 family metallopeptidase [Gammaproteobacteria bacterium]|nr:M48 family metallopeptidase [Gammaproteobacteria bacterium]